MIITEPEAARNIMTVISSTDLSHAVIPLLDKNFDEVSKPICDTASETDPVLLECEATRNQDLKYLIALLKMHEKVLEKGLVEYTRLQRRKVPYMRCKCERRMLAEQKTSRAILTSSARLNQLLIISSFGRNSSL
ncbi:hypothetical protein BG006_008092, partial [Podila minutissima]